MSGTRHEYFLTIALCQWAAPFWFIFSLECSPVNYPISVIYVWSSSFSSCAHSLICHPPAGIKTSCLLTIQSIHPKASCYICSCLVFSPNSCHPRRFFVLSCDLGHTFKRIFIIVIHHFIIFRCFVLYKHFQIIFSFSWK